MTMKYDQWEEILSAVNNEGGGNLNENNVIEKIKERLKVKDEDEYDKWEKADFDVNHRFEWLEGRKPTLLYLAVCHEAASVVNALLGVKEINVNAVVGRLEWTPLHAAANSICNESVDALLKSKKNVNAVDKDGRTPLHWAAAVSTESIVKALVENGADLLLRDNKGQTPRDLARDDYMKEFLKEAEEKQLRKQNEGTNNLPQNKDDNKDTTRLLGKTEKKQPTSAAMKGFFVGGSVAVLGAAIAVTLFATGTIAVELMPVVIAVAAIATAALAVGGVTYMLSKPSTKVDETKEQQNVNGKVPGAA